MRLLRFLPLVCALVLLAGCLSPSKRAQNSLDAVGATKASVSAVHAQRDKQAAANAYGVGLALAATPDPVPRSVEVAATLNERVRLAVGAPNAVDVPEIEKLVKGLLSEEREARLAAERRLEARDKQMVGLESQLAALNAKLAARETKRDNILQAVSGSADWIFWLKRGALVLFALWLVPQVLRLVGVLMPAAGPVAGLAAMVAGAVVRPVLRAVPAAAGKVGLVAKEQLDAVNGAFEDVVTAVQRARQDATVKATLDPILLEETDRRTSRPLIQKVKENL